MFAHLLGQYTCEFSLTRLSRKPTVVTAKEVWVSFTIFLATWCDGEEEGFRGEVGYDPCCGGTNGENTAAS